LLVAILIFEDEIVPRLQPISLSRPAYAISCGSYRLIDLAQRFFASEGAGSPRLFGLVRPFLAEIQSLDFPELAAPAEALSASGRRLLLNARLAPLTPTFEAIQQAWRRGETGVVWNGEAIAAAILPANAPPIAQGDAPADSRAAVAAYLQNDLVAGLPKLEIDAPLFEYAHDVVRYNLERFAPNIEYRLKTGDYRQLADGLFVGENVKIGEHLVCDVKGGPIVIENDVSIGPFAYLRGPVHLGAKAKLIEHASIKDCVSLGHTTKVGGEVEASIVEPFSNKQHYGFLGHSYLGSWVNMGAGTCNSDLKNTYGKVSIELFGKKIATGMQFMGCVIGDYSKSAINTSIFTGKQIGACSMLYGFITKHVPSFVNYARLFGEVTEMSTDVVISTQERMFFRRNKTQRPCDIQLIRDIFEITRDERRLSDSPPKL
jgi:UDP-N-acetylglucosamine diphosphorylase/glucosamine-1-phosphate N-acetyltransferase